MVPGETGRTPACASPSLTALALAAATAAIASPARYSLTLAGFPIGTLVVDQAVAGPNYDATARFKTTGLAGILDYSFEGEAQGLVAGLALDAGSLHRDEPVAARPPPHPHRLGGRGRPRSSPSIRLATKRWTLRPLPARSIRCPRSPGCLRNTTASGACGTAFEVFDGSRSVRLTLGEPRKAGGTITCDGDYLRLGGEPLTPIDPPECPFQLVYRTAANGQAILATIRIPTRFGQAVIEPAA